MTKQVGLTLNENDMSAINYLTKTLGFSSRAQAVRFALSLTSFLIRQLSKGDVQIVLRHKDGQLERVHMSEFDRINAYTSAA